MLSCEFYTIYALTGSFKVILTLATEKLVLSYQWRF